MREHTTTVHLLLCIGTSIQTYPHTRAHINKNHEYTLEQAKTTPALLQHFPPKSNKKIRTKNIRRINQHNLHNINYDDNYGERKNLQRQYVNGFTNVGLCRRKRKQHEYKGQ